jgi:hypothetical protein
MDELDWDNGTRFGRAFADTLVKKSYHKDLTSILMRVR